jgi:hypothetical protein
MADDRSLADIIRFVDPSGDMSDADIASISKNLKFTEVLDLISYIGKDDLDSARNILAKHDERFTIAREYSTVPTAAKTKSMFKPIQSKGTSPTTTASQDGEEEDVNAVLNAPENRNKPEVKRMQDEIRGLLDKLKR